MKAILRFSFISILSLFLFSFLNAQTQVGNDIDGEDANDWFGYSESFSGDGNRIIIGGPESDNTGYAKILEWDGNNWNQIGANINRDGRYGWSVDISSDGNLVVIGGPTSDLGPGAGAGRSDIFEWNGSNWVFLDRILGEGNGDNSGNSVSMSSDGSIIAIGAYLNDGTANAAGHVRVFERDGGNNWNQIGADIDAESGGDEFGHSVSLSSDGERLAVGAPKNAGSFYNAGHVRIFEWDGSDWIQMGSDIDGDGVNVNSGYSISLSSNGERVVIGAPRNNTNGISIGQVKIFDWNGSDWVQIGQSIYGESPGDQFGWSVSITSGGEKIAIGARNNDGNGNNAGHCRIYDWNGSSWIKYGDDIDGEYATDESGWSVSISPDGSYVAVGSRYNDDNGSNAGHVRIYENIGPLPIEIQSFTAYQADQNVHLSWKTSSETNSSGFDLQHSIDGINWNKLDFIESKGDTEQLSEYQYMHPGPVKGINYYRLKMIDLDGSYEYSDIVPVQFDQQDQIRIFPNPTSGMVNIQGIESGEVKIFNSIGSLVKTLLLVDQEIDIRELPNGLYYLSVRSDSQLFSEKIFKQ